MTEKIKAYKKELDYSYTSGAYATLELIKTRPEAVACVYYRTSWRDNGALRILCDENRIPCIQSDRAFDSVNQKENSYVLGVFRKYMCPPPPDEPHIVLVNPSDMGNLGTILRTAAGFNIPNLAVIEPAADIWNPKTIRASMGAVFRTRHAYFESFEAYCTRYPGHSLFPFMLDAEAPPEQIPICRLFSLVFGNEASGLDRRFADIGCPVKIPLTSAVDSFNLAVAVGIGAYVFAVRNKLI